MSAGRWAYVAMILAACLSGLHLSSDLHAAGARLVRAVSLSPSLSWADVVDGLRNVVLFAGFGVVWMLTSPRAGDRAEIRRATLMGLVLSACIEGVQVFSNARRASVADVASNTIGAAAGAVVVVDRKSVV